MEIKAFKIESKADVVAFFIYLQQELNLNFHPDTPFTDYIDLSSEEATFTEEQAGQLNCILEDCFEWCGTNGLDIYEVAMQAYYKANKIVDFHLDSIDLNGPMGNAYFLMAAWRKAAQEAGWTKEEIDAVITECQSSNYDHLLDTLRKNSHQ